ncbi:hypothetical protein YB2330_002978 [Saitoella coloradoensis]
MQATTRKRAAETTKRSLRNREVDVPSPVMTPAKESKVTFPSVQKSAAKGTSAVKEMDLSTGRSPRAAKRAAEAVEQDSPNSISSKQSKTSSSAIRKPSIQTPVAEADKPTPRTTRAAQRIAEEQQPETPISNDRLKRTRSHITGTGVEKTSIMEGAKRQKRSRTPPPAPVIATPEPTATLSRRSTRASVRFEEPPIANKTEVRDEESANSGKETVKPAEVAEPWPELANTPEVTKSTEPVAAVEEPTTKPNDVDTTTTPTSLPPPIRKKSITKPRSSSTTHTEDKPSYKPPPLIELDPRLALLYPELAPRKTLNPPVSSLRGRGESSMRSAIVPVPRRNATPPPAAPAAAPVAMSAPPPKEVLISPAVEKPALEIEPASSSTGSATSVEMAVHVVRIASPELEVENFVGSPGFDLPSPEPQPQAQFPVRIQAPDQPQLQPRVETQIQEQPAAVLPLISPASVAPVAPLAPNTQQPPFSAAEVQFYQARQDARPPADTEMLTTWFLRGMVDLRLQPPLFTRFATEFNSTRPPHQHISPAEVSWWVRNMWETSLLAATVQKDGDVEFQALLRIYGRRTFERLVGGHVVVWERKESWMVFQEVIGEEGRGVLDQRPGPQEVMVEERPAANGSAGVVGEAQSVDEGRTSEPAPAPPQPHPQARPPTSTANPNPPTTGPNPSPTYDSYTCPRCSLPFPTSSDLQTHLLSSSSLCDSVAAGDVCIVCGIKTDSPTLQKTHYAHHLRLEGGVFERVGIGHVRRQDARVPGLAGEAGRMKAGDSGMGVLRMKRKDVNKERAEAKEKDVAKESEKEKEKTNTSSSTTRHKSGEKAMAKGNEKEQTRASSTTTRHKSGERPKQPEPRTPLFMSQTPSLSPTAVRTSGTGATTTGFSMIDPALMAMSAPPPNPLPPPPPPPPSHASGVQSSDPSHPSMIYIPGSGTWYVLPAAASPTGQIYNHGPLPTSQPGQIPNSIGKGWPPPGSSTTGATSMSMSPPGPGPSPLPTPPSSVIALPVVAPSHVRQAQAAPTRPSQSPVVTLVVTEGPQPTPTPKHNSNAHRSKPPAIPTSAPAPSYQGYQGRQQQQQPPHAQLTQISDPRHATWSTFQQLELMEWVAQDEKERWRRASHRFGRSVEECIREAEAIGYKVFKLGPSSSGGGGHGR